MAPSRYHSNNAAETTLSAPVDTSQTNITVGSTSGFPTSFPFVLVLDYETATKEAVLVTAAAGATLTVTRGYDSTTAQAHALGTRVVHGVVAADLREPLEHISSTAGVHGVTGDIVGTTATQTLVSKTISGADNTLTNLPAGAISGDYKEGRFIATSPGNVPLTTRGAASQTGDLFVVEDSAGVDKFTVQADGDVTVGKDLAASGNVTAAGNVSAATATVTGNGSVGGTLAVGAAAPDSGNRAQINVTNANTSALKMKTTGAGQVSDLWWGEHNGNRTGYGNEKGELRSRAGAANSVALRCQAFPNDQTNNPTVSILEATLSDNTWKFKVLANGNAEVAATLIAQDAVVGNFLTVLNGADVAGTFTATVMDASVDVRHGGASLGRGVATGSKSVTAGSFPAATDNSPVVVVSTTFTAVAGRAYEFTFRTGAVTGTSGAFARAELMDGATFLGTSGWYQTFGSFQPNLQGSVTRKGLSAGSHTITLNLRKVGSGTTTAAPSTDDPAQIIIKDIGPDSRVA